MTQNRATQRTDSIFLPAALAVVGLALVASLAVGAPLGTAFTYQGVLKDDMGNPQTGSFDFIFELHDDASTDSQVGPTVMKSSVTVTDGLFIVELDFGAVFDGTDLWLEIAVDDGGGSTVLSPRQHLTAAPYALFAPNPDPPCFSNTNRYVDCGNGTVTDTVTGLIWLQNANCFGVQKYAAANQSAAALAQGACGLTDGSQSADWRLPTKTEWEATIARAVALGCTSGGAGSPPSLTNDPGTACLSVGPSAFSDVSSVYWSSTSHANFPSAAYRASLSAGAVSSLGKNSAYFVWPVR